MRSLQPFTAIHIVFNKILWSDFRSSTGSKDPAAFDKYYHEKHIPIAKRMKGLKKWTIGKVLGTANDAPSPYYYVADLYAESREAFDEILASPEGKAAVADVANYATGGATFIYTEVEEII